MARTVTARLNDEKELEARFEEYQNDHDIKNQSEAFRNIADEGLAAMGYEPSYRETSERFLNFARGLGAVFGLTALILYGIGTFLPAFSRFGLGLAIVSIAFFAGAEVADRHGDAIYRWARKAARNEAEKWVGGDPDG